MVACTRQLSYETFCTALNGCISDAKQGESGLRNNASE